jgi:hypothetical protein
MAKSGLRLSVRTGQEVCGATCWRLSPYEVRQLRIPEGAIEERGHLHMEEREEEEEREEGEEEEEEEEEEEAALLAAVLFTVQSDPGSVLSESPLTSTRIGRESLGKKKREGVLLLLTCSCSPSSSHATCEKMPLFSQLFLCLSRACLSW